MPAAVLVAALFSITATAGTIFRYHDPKTKRDVFVNQRDQIPVERRDEAQQVIADGVLVDSVPQKKNDGVAGTVIYGDRQPAGWWEALHGMARQALRAPGRIDWQRALTVAVDTDLVRRGLRPLAADETQRGLSLVARIGWLGLGAMGVTAVGWIWLMVQAWVAGQRAWMLGLLLCQPLSLLYAVKAAGQSGWWRALMIVAQLGPVMALATGACWLHTWFAAVLRARGLS